MTDWQAVDTELRNIVRERGRLDLEEGRLLIVARREAVHARLGLASFREYMERVLGYDPHTTSERLRVAEELAQLPHAREAVATGALTYSGARELTRVLVPETEQIWLDATRGRTVREVQSMVAGRRKGDLPDTPPRPDLRPRWLRYEVSTETYAMLREARKVVQESTGAWVSDDEFLRAMCEAVLRPGDASEHHASPYQIALTVCQECDRGWQDGAGVVVDVPEEVVEGAWCDADVISADEPSRSTPVVPPATRRAADRRAHGRCQVPGCRATRHLHRHHIDHDPTNHDIDNLVVLCGAHHRLHHRGLVSIEYRDGELVFAHADGRRYGAPPPWSQPPSHVGPPPAPAGDRDGAGPPAAPGDTERAGAPRPGRKRQIRGRAARRAAAVGR